MWTLTCGEAERLLENQLYNSSCLWLFNVHFFQTALRQQWGQHFLLHLWSQNFSYRDKNKINLIKHEQSWETIWDASVQFDKQDGVEVCDLDQHCAFVATSYWLRVLAWTWTQLWPSILSFHSCPLCSSSQSQKTSIPIVLLFKMLLYQSFPQQRHEDGKDSDWVIDGNPICVK